MAGSASDRVLGQVHRLFNFGAVGTMSDGQLLARFVSRRDQAAEAAFEELVIRHGPMVFQVCRNVLHDAHDAEDAFQAVFLVLANRAWSIRQNASVASWLFGVAERVAIRGRRTAARRRALEGRVARRNSASELPAENDPDCEILHDEIKGLPERLRAPIVLCYLQGLTYDRAAHQLGLTEVAIRGRLARARERLRHRLTRRGVTVPAGLFSAGAAGQLQAAVPATLIEETVRVALGFGAGNTAAILARGVVNSMLLNRVKVLAVLLLIGIGSSYWAWHTLAAFADAKGRENSEPVVTEQPDPPAAVVQKPQSTQPKATYRLIGSVRVDGTGEPVPGGRFTVTLSDAAGASNPDESRIVTSGPDGQFSVDLPAGQAMAWTFQAPVGYWALGNRNSPDTFVLSRWHPIHRKDYVVRRGNVWRFLLTRANWRPKPGGAVDTPVRGQVRAATAGAIFVPEADKAGRVSLTLPTGQGAVTATAAMHDSLLSFASVPLAIPLEWAADFRPEAVKSIDRLSGGYRVTDDEGRWATIGQPVPEFPSGTGGLVTLAEPGRVEPSLVDGKLIIRVVFTDAGRAWPGNLSGRVVDQAGTPIDGALVALAFHFREGHSGGGLFPDGAEYRATTDDRGQFVLHAIPRGRAVGRSTSLSLIVHKDGFANLQTPVFAFRPGLGELPHMLDPIRMEPGVLLSGTVVDPDGQPAEGVWVPARGRLRDA